MKEKIKIEDFQEDIKQTEYKNIYKEIVEKSLDLGEEIINKKHIKIEKCVSKEDEIDEIIYVFEVKSATFKELSDLMKEILACEKIYKEKNKKIEEKEIRILIELYNMVVDELKQYEEIEKQIKQQGYERLEKEKIEQLIQLFKEMLEYKNKKYRNDWSFKEWIDNVNTYYHYFNDSLINTINALQFGSIWEECRIDEEMYLVQINQVEKIMLITELYKKLKCEEDGYKEYADWYIDFDLEEGQTYEDLYRLEKKKYVELFKEMLDFLNVSYEGEGFDELECLVIEKYPYYFYTLTHLDCIRWNTKETYITVLDSMERIYRNISKNYKNHEQNMKEYEEEQKNLEEMEFIDEDEDEN